MPRRLIRRYLPDPERLRREKSLQIFGDAIYDPNLWHLNRHSAAVAVAVGLFCAFIPMPMQMLLAAVVAVWLRCNLPIAVILVWITNPLTMPPIFAFTYAVGAWMLGREAVAGDFDLSWGALADGLSGAIVPLYLGSLTVGTILATAGYLAVRISWRLHVAKQWKARRTARAARAADAS